MPRLELTVEQVIELVKQLPAQEKRAILARLNADLEHEDFVDAETSEWLDADLGEDLLPYNWGEAGIPTGKPIRYIPEIGFTIEGGRTVAESS